MSKFRTNVLDVLEHNPVLKLPHIANGCNVVQYENLNGIFRLNFYKLENSTLYYFAFNEWQGLPDFEYVTKCSNLHYCEKI